MENVFWDFIELPNTSIYVLYKMLFICNVYILIGVKWQGGLHTCVLFYLGEYLAGGMPLSPWELAITSKCARIINKQN